VNLFPPFNAPKSDFNPRIFFFFFSFFLSSFKPFENYMPHGTVLFGLMNDFVFGSPCWSRGGFLFFCREFFLWPSAFPFPPPSTTFFAIEKTPPSSKILPFGSSYRLRTVGTHCSCLGTPRPSPVTAPSGDLHPPRSCGLLG